jgi:hypothetical protein
VAQAIALMKKVLFVPLFLLLIGLFFAPRANAASLISGSDTITTSRPSASAPLAADQAASAGQATIVDNGSFFISSDSAVLWNDTGETLNTVNVASMSAANLPSAGQRIVYFTNTAANTHHAGDPITAAVTAKHTIVFTTVTTIPVNGKIIITFPGAGNNTASPSATTFAFNNLQDANISASFSLGTSTCTFTHSAPTITCTIATAQVSGGTTVTITVGATTPALINPTKTAAAGTADIWKVSVESQDNNSIGLDSGSAKIGTIESVQVQATVDPTLTFTIAAVSGAINTGNTTGCANTEAVSSGIASTATAINLGLLNTANINISAQLITISTNAQSGYALTATSSGHLINNANGVWIPDSTTPTAMTVNVPWFGIHACGLNVNGTTWGTGATGGGINAKYGWPTPTTAVTLASAATGPIGNTVATGGVGAGLTSVEYAGAVDVSIPAGVYTSVITYTATPTF